MNIKVCAESDLGRSRSVNEDLYLVDSDSSLYLVADGMGGHGNGEIASRITVQTIAKYLRKRSSSSSRRLRGGKRQAHHSDRLREAIKAANEQVLAEVEKDEQLTGMGATLVALLVDGSTALVAHVGDSRAYRLREGQLEQLTDDHTWVHEQVSAGLLSDQDARSHPFRSVVTRAVGGGEDVLVDLESLDLRSGDTLLLCSDGLNAVLSDGDIQQKLQEGATLEARCRELVAAANAGGGPDNITVVLLEIQDDE
ncbi:MAG: Stp1/IreP family PP2C-type Ser/Thr phosphatase [Acidobacteriota bacterium]|nr:Stp1/IreP family PP2C-type Ser/Thr phosphatase [Acidobacteriota bacterium]